MLTEIIFVLDRSGSMAGSEGDVIGGYNGFVKKQLKEEGETRITTVLFDGKYEVLHDELDAMDVILTTREYFVRGMTALHDAVGKTIISVQRRHDRIEKSERPDHVIFIITTDGYENASSEFTKRKIKEMITHQMNEHGWEFIFMAADIDSFAIGHGMGIRPDMTMKYAKTSTGIKAMYDSAFALEKKAKKNYYNKRIKELEIKRKKQDNQEDDEEKRKEN